MFFSCHSLLLLFTKNINISISYPLISSVAFFFLGKKYAKRLFSQARAKQDLRVYAIWGLGASSKQKIWSNPPTMDPNGDSSPIPTETQKRSFAPSTVSAYLDPHYW